MIDLHTHTTASDGRLSPSQLVARASSAGVTVLAVTDHDTVAACGAVAEACAKARITFVPGIEVTAALMGDDVHMLGYFFDPQSPSLEAFLDSQRRRRLDRVREMVGRLARFDIRLDAEAILRPGVEDATKSAGRPWIARALVAGGYVATTAEAFDRWLARDRPAFVPRAAAAPADVIARIHDAGGITSVAHPGLLGRDEWISGFAGAGLDAIEAHHTRHDADATAHYRAMAERLQLAVSGGSDFHGDESHGAAHPGAVSLPRDDFDRLVERGSPSSASEPRPR
ncbi:MAG: PHP domain-containing protein [Acidobacteria bacterium]|nr:PHP domain-containing protein [Acidobacteriota bacterium]